MTLRYTTIANANDRRRFVTPEAAEPYLNGRARQNLLRAAHKANTMIAAALVAPRYGTAKRQHRARRLRIWAERLVEAEAQLAAYPPPGEAIATAPVTYQLAAVPVTTAFDQLAAD